MRDIRSIKNINIHKNNPMPIGKFKQRSNATLVLDLYDEHMNYVDLTNQEVSIRIERPDTVTFEQIDGVTKENNILTIKLKNEVLDVCGKCRVELNLKDSTGQMTSADFYFEVGKTVLNDEIVFSSDSYESLEKALVLFQKESQAMMKEFDANEKVRINNENTRKTNEVTRVNAETDRVRVESLRVQAENTRVSNENTRKSNESTRQSQESTRQQQETNRQNVFSTNETNRQNTFNTSERDRTSTFNTTQTDRQNTFNQSEASRSATFTRNEETRQTNETTRISSENSRVGAENIRKSSEDGRVSAETDRVDKFDKMQTDGNKLIGDMQTVVDSNIGAEVVEARKGKAKLNDRLDEIENHVPVWQEQVGQNGNLTINDGFEGTLKNLVIKGKTVGGWNAETQQSDNIVSSGENEGNKIIVKSVGKNLFKFNRNVTSNGITFTGDNSFSVSTATGWATESYTFKVANNTNIVMSATEKITSNKLSIQLLIADGSVVRTLELGKSSPISPGEYKIKLARSGATDTVGEVINIQLETNTIATNYEEYKEDKKEVVLPFTGGLKEWDLVKYDIGQIEERTLKYTFNGNESVRLSADKGTNFSVFRFDLEATGSWNVEGDICNRFIRSDNIAYNGTGEAFAVAKDGLFWLSISKDKADTVEKLKTWLKANETIVVTKRKTPIIHNIEKMTMPQYAGTTHIIQENEVAGDISCKAKISLSAQGKRLKEENQILKATNEKLIENAKITELDQEVQNGKITTTMLANTELFEIVIGLMPMSIDTKNDKGGVDKMVEVYVTLIIQGDKTLEQVPSIIRPKVEAKLRLLGIIE